jgi:hypothetical protein
MNCLRTLLLIPLLCISLPAEPLGAPPISGLQTPSVLDASRAKRLESIGLDWWMHNRGLLAEESLKIAGYFSVVRPIKGFANRDDIVWEIRIIHLDGSPTGILWINEKTRKVIGLGVEPTSISN